MQWIRETPATWDEDKADMLAGLEPALFGLGSPEPGDHLGDEWWRVEESGEVLGYGRLDDTWGDAEILVLVGSGHRLTGVGRFVVSQLESEAGRRGLNYIYNVVPDGHPNPEQVTGWLSAQGFEANDVGEFRKKVAAT